MVINLRTSAHDPAQLLLPWYLNGTLDEAEQARVEAHLAECTECRAELEPELGLAASLTAFASDGEMASDPGLTSPVSAPAGARRLRIFRRPVALGWALAGQAAAAALFLALFLARPTQPAPDAYHVLGSERAPNAGNVIVLFAPDTRELTVRKALSEAGARVVDGPTASGAYLLNVPDQRRHAALERLRADPQVTLAEPIGGE